MTFDSTAAQYPAQHIDNYGLSINPEVLATLQIDVKAWDVDKFLPPATLDGVKINYEV
jgi:hypothetical protein